MKLSELNLKRFPFESLTPTQSQNLFWSGMVKQKKAISTKYEEISSSNYRKVVLNWGPYGGGKTHAAYYFQENPPVREDIQVFTNIIRTPQEGKGASIKMIKNIFDDIPIRKLKQEISRARKELGEEELFELIFSRIGSEAFTEAIILLSRDLYPPLIFQRFVFDGLSNTELKKLNIPRSLKSDDDYIVFLAGCIVAMTAGEKEKRFVLWIDEMENMVYYNSQQFKVVSQTLRDLIDRVNEKMLVFMNFTLSENADDTVRLLIGDALWQRINEKVRFSNLSREEAIQYCKDRIKEFQIDPSSNLSPFDTASIEAVIKTMPEIDLVPREINRKMHSLLKYAIENSKSGIDIVMTKEWLNSQNS